MDNIHDNIHNEERLIPEPHEPEGDECFSKGICSLNPNLSSVHEVILLYLKELSFYLLRLKNFGITNEKIKETVVYALFNIITNAEYNQEKFRGLISNLYDYINQSKFLYERACSERNIEIEVHKTYFKYGKNFDLTDAIRKGEKYFIKKSLYFSQQQKDFYDILLFLGKSMGLKLIELQRLGKDHDDAYYTILSLFDTKLPEDFVESNVKTRINKIIEIYYDLVKQVYFTQIELYGERQTTEVSFSTIPGKAILVSGSDFKKLELLLKATEGKDINIYTHGIEMLMAHTFPKLKAYPHLKGHFGTSMESSLIDFASFPGSILMTKATLQKIEYLYRGRLFTLDPIAPPGIIVIKDSNFEPLIRSTLNAKGFTSSIKKPPMQVGFDEQEINKKIDNIIAKILNKEIKHFFIIGLLNSPNLAYKTYFETLFKIMPKDSFAFSLCCPINTKNVFHLDSFYDYSLIYKILKKIKTKMNIQEMDISVFLTKCDKHTISNLLYLKHAGIKNIFMCKCPTNLLNPSIIKTLQDAFDIKEISDPQSDLNYILNRKNKEKIDD